MRGYSRTIITGNLGGDPELRYTPGGTPVANFSVAVNRRKSVGGGEWADATDWYRVSIFGKQAEIADQYLTKGAPVLVDGRLEIDHYTGNDGVERTSVKIVADNFLMLGQRDDADSGAGGSPASSGQRAPAATGSGASAEGWNYSDDLKDELDDVPFD